MILITILDCFKYAILPNLEKKLTQNVMQLFFGFMKFHRFLVALGHTFEDFYGREFFKKLFYI